MKILIDMNLSPDWVAAFAAENLESVHWSTIADPRADDTVIIEYARTHGYIVFTHDLDFWNDIGVDPCRRPERYPSPHTGYFAVEPFGHSYFGC